MSATKISGKLAISGCTLDSRMRRVADTIAFLSSWQINDSIDRHQRLKGTEPKEREFIFSNFCRFDDGVFTDLGEAIVHIGMGGEKGCIYLK